MDNVNKWLVTACAVFLALCYQVSWMAYAAIPYQTASYFEVDLDYVDIFLITVPFLISFFVEFLAMFLTDYYGPKLTLLVSCAGCLLGGAVRIAAFYLPEEDRALAFWLLFASTFIGAFFGTFTYVVPAKIAAIWFDQDQRILANNIMSQAQQIGLALGLGIGPLFIREGWSEADFRWHSTVPLGLSLVAAVLLLIYLYLSNWTGYPIEEPPSYSSQEILRKILNVEDRPSKSKFLSDYSVYPPP